MLTKIVVKLQPIPVSLLKFKLIKNIVPIKLTPCFFSAVQSNRNFENENIHTAGSHKALASGKVVKSITFF